MLRGLFRTKNLDDILAAIGGPQYSLKPTLGAFNVTLIAPASLPLLGLPPPLVKLIAGPGDRLA